MIRNRCAQLQTQQQHSIMRNFVYLLSKEYHDPSADRLLITWYKVVFVDLLAYKSSNKRIGQRGVGLERSFKY